MIILFDLDDTLLDDLAAKNHYMPKLYRRFKNHIQYGEEEFYDKWREAIAKYERKYEAREMTFEEHRAARVSEAFGNANLTQAIIMEAVRAFNAYYEESWKPFRNTIGILEYLEDFRKGIISNGSGVQQNRKIDALGIRNYFEVILISEEVGISKPDTRIFLKACELFDCAPSECFFIGNSWEADVEGSSRAGMKPVWFNRYRQEMPSHVEDLDIIYDLEELRELIGAQTD